MILNFYMKTALSYKIKIMKQLLTIFAFISFCSFAQNDVTVTINRKPQFYGYLKPVKLKINGKKYKVRNTKSIVVQLKNDEKFQIKSNFLFNKKVIYEAPIKENKTLEVKYKFSFIINPMIVKN